MGADLTSTTSGIVSLSDLSVALAAPSELRGRVQVPRAALSRVRGRRAQQRWQVVTHQHDDGAQGVGAGLQAAGCVILVEHCSSGTHGLHLQPSHTGLELAGDEVGDKDNNMIYNQVGYEGTGSDDLELA